MAVPPGVGVGKLQVKIADVISTFAEI